MKNKIFILAAVFAATFAFSTVTFAQQQRCTEDGSIKRVTKSVSGNFELVTFEVLSTDPAYKVTTAKVPFSEYGSEKPLHIKGPYYKSIVLTGINWTCKISEKLSAATTTITAVKSVEQFEGQVEYIIGYKTKGKFVSSYKTGTGNSRKVVLKFKR